MNVIEILMIGEQRRRGRRDGRLGDVREGGEV
jgi:hypothetical protein